METAGAVRGDFVQVDGQSMVFAEKQLPIASRKLNSSTRNIGSFSP
jgi:hypothetical protein